MITVPIEVSNRHVHLSAEHLVVLFGLGAELTVRRPISQTGQFAAEQTVTLVGPAGSIERVRVVGPIRAATQVEVSQSNASVLGLEPPLRDSGDLAGTPGLTLVGPAGQVVLNEGVIRQRRHIHASPADCQAHSILAGAIVKVRVGKYDFDNVFIKVHPSFVWRLHLDTDEANLAGIKGGESAEVIT